MEFQSDLRREKENADTSGSTTESGSSSSENLAPSPKRVNQNATPESKQQQSKQVKPTRRSNRARQPTLAGALGNPIPINTVEDTLQSPIKKFSIDSPSDKQTRSQNMKTPDQTPPSLRNWCFQEKSPEYQACLTFLDAIRPKEQTSTTQLVDLVSPAETPEKSTDNLEVLSKMNVHNVEEAKFEEHQEKANKEEQITAEKL